MSSDWVLGKLSDYCKTSSGGTPLKSNQAFYDGGTIPWLLSGEVGTKEITSAKNKITEYALENSSAKVYPENSVLIAMYGATAGEVGILRFPSASNQAVCAIYPSEHFTSEFLYYFFLSFKVQLIAQAVGNAQPNISQAKIKETFIPIISITEQKQIVDILDQAFTAIDQAQANIQQNIQNAQDLFQSKLNQIFSQQGEGWEEKTWEEVLDIRSGRNQKAVLDPDGKYPIYGSAGKVMGYANDYLCEEGTTIIGRKGSINSPKQINEKFWNVDTAFGLHALEGLNKEFLYYFCLSYDFTQRDKGSGRPSLVKKDLLKMTMPISSPSKQELIVIEIKKLNSSLEKLKENYSEKLSSLEELKKSLLQKAFSGELTQDKQAT